MSQSKRSSDSKNYHKYQIDIKEYEILHQIESGGFGLVYSVQNIKTKKTCAAKVNNTHSDEAQYKKMINREIGIMLRCQHPTIINFIGYSFIDFNNQKNVTIFMDLAKKGSLAEILNKAKNGLLEDIIDNTMKQIILVGIARGMMFLHQQQIIHRDLKPGNILIDENYHPLITDFGLSKFYETGRSMIQSQQCGTSMYMAPEIIEGNKYNGKVDVYSFGIVMYEIITNSPPYPLLLNGKMTPYSFNKKVVENDYRPTFKYPINKTIKQLIEKCWAKDPKERPTFEEIFKKLAYNIDDLVDNIYEDFENDDDDEKEITNYYLDDVDVNEVISYANDIDNPTKQIINDNSETKDSINDLIQEIINPLKKENEKLKNQINYILKEKETEKNENDKKIEELKEKYEKDKKELDMKYQNLIQSMKQDYDDKFKNIIEMINNKTDQLPNIQKDIEQNNNKTDQLPNIQKDIEQNNNNNNDDIKDDENEIQVNKKIEEIEDNDQKSIENITISEFNNLLLKQQQSFIEKLSKTSDKMSQYFTKINQLLIFLLKLDQINKECIEITGNNDDKLIDINEEYRILICHSATEILFNSKNLNKQDFLNLVKQFPEISIELKYPSNMYQKIYDCVFGIQKMQLEDCKLSIAIYITGIEKTDQKFKENQYINYVKLSSNVSEIDKYSFIKCVNLIEISIPHSVTSIGYCAFEKCKSLTHITIPPSVTSIGNSAFNECESLIHIAIPPSMTLIKSSIFSRCKSLTHITIPPSVTSIGSSAFNDCKSLTHITIPPSVTSIECNAFFGCESLTYIMIPPFIKEIEGYIFFNCIKLTEITIPSSIETIEKDAFVCCQSLKKITFEEPSSLTSIKDDAFSLCSSLTEITIPSSVTYIGESFLSQCKKLSKINIQNYSDNQNSERNFKFVDNKMIIIKSNPKIDEFDTLIFVLPSLETVTIPSFVKKIGKKAFSNCSFLKEVSIPSSITSIGESAFYECNSLIKVSISNSVTSLGPDAFESCISLKTVIIPSSVTSIGRGCFTKCSSLEEIAIPSSIDFIEEYVFYRCSSLKQISIPQSIHSIKYCAFGYCTSLKQIELPSSLSSIDSGVFQCCYNLESITIPSNLDISRLDLNPKIKIKRI